jgi:hypothetical protein
MEKGGVTEEEYLKMISREGNEEAPTTLFSNSVLYFSDNLVALELFFETEDPPLVSDQVSKLALVIYTFTEASDLGFGDTFLFDKEIEYTIDTWGIDEEGESSNYKELQNTVDAIEPHAEEGTLLESMLFFCMDNWTVENALYHGRSKMSRSLIASQAGSEDEASGSKAQFSTIGDPCPRHGRIFQRSTHGRSHEWIIHVLFSTDA